MRFSSKMPCYLVFFDTFQLVLACKNIIYIFFFHLLFSCTKQYFTFLKDVFLQNQKILEQVTQKAKLFLYAL